MRWTPGSRLSYLVGPWWNDSGDPTSWQQLRATLISASVAALAFVAILFVFLSASVLRTFEVYPHNALFLIEVVLAVLTASAVGVLYAHQRYQR